MNDMILILDRSQEFGMEIARRLRAEQIYARIAPADTAVQAIRELNPRGVILCGEAHDTPDEEIVKLGMSISLGGVVTFKNARQSVEVAEYIPLDRLLLETDAPYLTPVPFRGKRCDSSMIKFTAMRIAEIKGISMEELLEITAKNACRLYNIEL